MDPETGEPKDELLPEAKVLIAKLGSSCTKVSEVLASKDEKVYSEITAGLERANEQAISRPQRVKLNQLIVLINFNYVTMIGPKVHYLRQRCLCIRWGNW